MSLPVIHLNHDMVFFNAQSFLVTFIFCIILLLKISATTRRSFVSLEIGMIFLVLTAVLIVRSGCQQASRGTDVDWPTGVYGLPKAKSGCPKSETSVWRQGWRFQDMEDVWKSTSARSRTSTGFHMEFKFHGGDDKRDINRTFCMKQARSGIQTRSWPKGEYCIYKGRHATCPNGMSQGWVRWDDEDYSNFNKKGGSLPAGKYDKDTIIYYCCQILGNWYDSIELPVVQPFYLLTSSSTNAPKCQMVKWALVYLEYIVFDTNDQDNADRQSGYHALLRVEYGRTVYYCYYEGCRRTMTRAWGSFQSYQAPVNGNVGPFSQYCSWVITIAEPYVISLSFKELNIPSCYDTFIRIYDGLNDTAPLLGTFCGANATTEVQILSSTNNLYFVANSGSPNQVPFSSIFRFHAQYNAEHMTGCGYEVIGNSGYIQSPVFDLPSDYPRHHNCSWLVTVDDAYLVALNFTLLKFPTNNNDVIEIYDGENEHAALIIRYSRLDADRINETLVSSSNNNVYIILKYGNFLSRHSEFIVNYTSHPKPTTEIFREVLTKMHTRSTVKAKAPESETAGQSGGSSTIYIVVAVVVGVCIILILIACVFFLRRRRNQAAASRVFNGINPSYSWRKKSSKATDNDEDDAVYANPSSPQERVWVGNSRICKESKNPIYETGKKQEPAVLYSSADSHYQPLVVNNGGAAQTNNPLYDSSEVASSHVYAEPSSPQKSIVYDEPDVGV